MSIDATLKGNIDWLYERAGNEPPTKFVGWRYPVKIYLGTWPAVRGPMGARDCLLLATTYAYIGTNDGAMSWLCAGQAHNGDVINSFNINQDICLKYIKETYLQAALVRWGQLFGISSGQEITLSYAMDIEAEISDYIKNQREGGANPPAPRDIEGHPRPRPVGPDDRPNPGRDRQKDLDLDNGKHVIINIYL